MKEQFRNKKFNKRSLMRLHKVMEIIGHYQLKQIRLTLRQLYYQLVARDLIPNKTSEYGKLSCLVTDARYAGIIDWNAIEDRIRVPQKHQEYENVLDLVKAAIESYRLDRWDGQKHYVELFTEKDAISSVLRPITDKYHIYMNVNRGYSSATAMYDAAQRFSEADIDGKICILLYLGDHDPSGLDMIRDIQDRLDEFCSGSIVEVIPIALTMEQIEKYNPPPNPAKITDPRARKYILQHGKISWEVDALPPDIMQQTVIDAIEKYVDWKLMNEVIDQEKEDKKQLVEFAEGLESEET